MQSRVKTVAAAEVKSKEMHALFVFSSIIEMDSQSVRVRAALVCKMIAYELIKRQDV
jgi:hypothetical protein